MLKKEFLNPSDEFTPIPFWFWNDDLNEPEIKRQIHDFCDKGVKGFVIHPRIGIPKEIEYLSDRFMELVKFAVLEAKSLGMKVVLYDEAMYPSGSAHGMVVKNNPEYASKGLQMIENKCCGRTIVSLKEYDKEKIVAVLAVKKISDKDIEKASITKIEPMNGEVVFDAPANEEWSILLFVETFSKGHIRGIHFGEDDKEPEAPPASDLLNPEAMKEFIKLTHERYYEVLKEEFGKTIIAMFTDEPSILGRGGKKGLKSWTSNFLNYYIEQGNSELDLPLLWFNAGEASDTARRKYNDAVNKMLETTYYKQVFDWCDKHNIDLTGHPHEPDDIGYLKYFHTPAQDLVFRWVAPENGLNLEGAQSTIGKCSSDSARHRNRRRNGNECLACCGKNSVEWSLTADDMKWYLDWLFVRGVNLLYPHAFFYSIKGDRRIGERPPDVGPNNIWWPHYNIISTYMKRMSWLMTDSYNTTPIAVLCEHNHLSWRITKPLFENQLEFNYLEDEIFISDSAEIKDGEIVISKQKYKVLIIDDVESIDKDNTDKLQKFIDMGGHVILHNPENKKVNVKGIEQIQNVEQLVSTVDSLIKRRVESLNKAKGLRVSHVVKGNLDFYLLVNEGEENIDTVLRFNETGYLEKWNPWTGAMKEIKPTVSFDRDFMEVILKLNRRESRIFVLDSSKKAEYTRFYLREKTYSVEELKTGWQFGQNLTSLKELKPLTYWSEIEGLNNFSGTCIYKNSFDMEDLNEVKKITLDLGKVHEIVRVKLNDKDLGVRMWYPYIYDITNSVKAGENTLVIEVTNTLANKICKLNLESGMIGPVELKIES